MRFVKTLLASSCLCLASVAQAQVLPEATIGIKIPLVAKPTTRPMTVAYVPYYSRYYIADGGLAPVPGDFDIPVSKSCVHAYGSQGEYIQSAKPGLDNRSIYFNPNTRHLESVTYNISAGAGFAPNTGIYTIDLNDQGDLQDSASEASGVNPAFGDASTMPTFDPESNRYYAKQERSNLVWIIDPGKREKVGEIALDLKAADVQSDDVSDHFIAYTGIAGEELALLDVDHKGVLIFDLKGKFIGKSTLPPTMKLHAQNHFTGLGYANGMFFVFHESEGEFGTYYGFKISDLAK